MSDIIVGGISLIAVLFGLVEFAKSVFNLSGRWVTLLSLLLGVVLSLAYSLTQMALPVDAAGWFTVAIQGLVFGLTASGFYKFVNKRVPEVVEFEGRKEAPVKKARPGSDAQG